MTETKYNPMSKEFRDECGKLGLTGYQLTVKYKKEGRSIKRDEVYFKREDGRRKPHEVYTDGQLLWFLIQFYEEYGRPPTERDFDIHPEYPSSKTYQNRFGSWSAALKLVGLDVESMVKKGIVETEQQKARLGEIIIRDHFKIHPVDLAGENCMTPYDGICPNGKTYDVKSSKLHKHSDNDIFYQFGTNNLYKEEIEIYYLLGFNEDYTKLEYGWRISGEIAEKDWFTVGLSLRREFNIENMKEYDITEKLRDVLRKYGFLK
jgi:hypothetical protein